MAKAAKGSSDGGLQFYDFVPKCIKPDSLFHWPEFEPFSTLINPVNDFLRHNPTLSVKSCETAHFLVEKDHVKKPDDSAYIQIGETLQPFVKGLRLWVVPRVDSATCDEIGYITFVPQRNGVTASTLADLTNNANYYLQQNPLPGRMVSVETLQMQGVTSGEVNVDASCWKPKTSLATLQMGYLTLFRLWYVKGEPKFEAVGLADFFPSRIVCAGGSSTSSSPVQRLADVMNAVDHWVSQLPGSISVLNMKTISTRVDKCDHHNAYTTFQWGAPFHYTYMKFIRLVYVVSPQASLPPAYERRHFTTRLFVPGLVREPSTLKSAKFECQSVVKQRLHDWAATTQANIVAVETVVLKSRSGGEAREGLDTMYTWNETHYDYNTKSEQPSPEQYIICYRVFLDGNVADPAGFSWPRTIEDYNREHAKDCIIA